MPCLQERVARDEHRQVRVPERVEYFREAWGAQSFADNEAVLLEER
jgi:hypothetical protein